MMDVLKNLFLSSSPLTSFAICINNKFDCYNINIENINIELSYYKISFFNDESTFPVCLNFSMQSSLFSINFFIINFKKIIYLNNIK